MRQRILAAIVLSLSAVTSYAALLGRLPLTPGGTDYQAVYDTDFDITWLADANYAAVKMDWATANSWASSLNIDGITGWRLPTTLHPDATCDIQFANGYSAGNHCTGSEMGHLFYTELGGSAGAFPPASAGLALFRNIQHDIYWSSTEYPPGIPASAMAFGMDAGFQYTSVQSNSSYAWAVHPGDIALAVDSDGDGISNGLDNCTLVANPTQLDTDGDGYGNICDADLNNSGLTTAIDFNLLRSCLNQPSAASALCAAADMNGSGFVTAIDFGLLRARINTPPGPSGLHP